MGPRRRSRGQQELQAAPALGRAGGRAASRGCSCRCPCGCHPPAHPRARSPRHPWHCRPHGAAWGQNGPLLSTWGCALSILLSACSLLCLARLLATLVPTVPQLCRTGPSSLGSSAAPCCCSAGPVPSARGIPCLSVCPSCRARLCMG